MQRLAAPSAHLPPIKRLLSLHGEEVKHHIVELGRVYAPDVAVFAEAAGIKPSGQRSRSTHPGKTTTRQRALKEVSDSGYVSLMASDDEADREPPYILTPV
jgi:hypothetical protein